MLLKQLKTTVHNHSQTPITPSALYVYRVSGSRGQCWAAAVEAATFQFGGKKRGKKSFQRDLWALPGMCGVFVSVQCCQNLWAVTTPSRGRESAPVKPGKPVTVHPPPPVTRERVFLCVSFWRICYMCVKVWTWLEQFIDVKWRLVK